MTEKTDAWHSRLLLFAKGFCMGSADVVPGVSGGTMALILGIYQRLIEAIRSFDLIWLRSLFRFNFTVLFTRPHFGFVIPLALGIVAALVFFTRVVPLPYLIEYYPAPVYGLFFGLIVGSIVILVQQLEHSPVSWIMLLLTTLAGWWIFNLVPAETPETAWFVFISGALAITAMILPGISGSFILLLLNKYAYIFAAIGQFDLSVLVPFVGGMITGIIVFSRLLSWLLRKFYQPTLAAVLGLLVASLWVIWPFQERVFANVAGKEKLVSVTPVWPDSWDDMAILAMILLVVGFAAVLMLHYLAGNKPATVSSERN